MALPLLGGYQGSLRPPIPIADGIKDPPLARDNEGRPDVEYVKVSLIMFSSSLSQCSALSDSCYSMKHDAIVEQGIPILDRIPIPDELIPEDSRVEIDAKIHAGYCESSSSVRLHDVVLKVYSHDRESYEHGGAFGGTGSTMG